jgi:hypothetical protein
MRFLALAIAASFGLTVALWPKPAATQDDRDFVFADDEGHLVLRFAGAEPGGLDANQMEEIVNASVSTMVHDRLRADVAFDAEPVASQWADSMEPRTERHVRAAGSECSAVNVECRSASCRLVLAHSNGRSVSEHQALMGIVQLVMEAFIEANPAGFEPVLAGPVVAAGTAGLPSALFVATASLHR